MARIFVIGYMGAGKTTVGSALATALGLDFIDLDSAVERREGKTIAGIFADDGEEAFRRIERDTLREEASADAFVMSCGGGTPCFHDNMDYMLARGETLYLRATTDVLLAHLRMGGAVRPLLQGKTDGEVCHFITGHLALREPTYLRAAHTLRLGVLDSEEKIRATVREARTLLGL